MVRAAASCALITTKCVTEMPRSRAASSRRPFCTHLTRASRLSVCCTRSPSFPLVWFYALQRKAGALPAVELRNRPDDLLLLAFAQLWEHGQREHFFGRALRLGQITGLISQICEALLQMQRNGVVDFGVDALLGQESPQFIASQRPHRILVIDVMSLGNSRQQCDRGLRIHGLCVPLHQA